MPLRGGGAVCLRPWRHRRATECGEGGADRVAEHTTRLLADGAVICLPTMPFPAPPRGLRLSERGDIHQRIDALVDVAGWAGVPQISLPLAEVDGLPVGLSLIGAVGADEMLMAFAREIAGSV